MSGILNLSSLSLTNDLLEGGQPLEATPIDTTVEVPVKLTNEETPKEDKEETNIDGHGSQEEEEEEEEESGNTNPDAHAGGASEEEEEEASVADIATAIGIPIPEGKVYSNDFEGITAWAKDIKPVIAEQAAAEFFEENPDVAEYFRAKVSGTLEDFFKAQTTPALDYENLELDETNEELLERLIVENRRANGLTETQINREIARIKNADELLVEATEAYETDKVRKVNEKTQAATAAQQAQAERIKAEKEQLEASKNLILGGKIGGITIPEAERKALFEARHKVVKDGKTALQLKRESLSEEQLIQLDYFLMKDFKLGKVAEREANTKKAVALLSKAKAGEKKSAMSGGAGGASTSGKIPAKINTSHLYGNTI